MGGGAKGEERRLGSVGGDDASVLAGMDATASAAFFASLGGLTTNFADARVRVGNTTFDCHRVVLAAHSRPLGSFLAPPAPSAHQPAGSAGQALASALAAASGPSPARQQVFHVSGHPDDFAAMLDWMYGRPTPPSTNLLSLLSMAMSYQVQALVRQCCDALGDRLTPEFAFDVVGITHSMTHAPECEALYAKAVGTLAEAMRSHAWCVERVLRDLSSLSAVVVPALRALAKNPPAPSSAPAPASHEDRDNRQHNKDNADHNNNQPKQQRPGEGRDVLALLPRVMEIHSDDGVVVGLACEAIHALARAHPAHRARLTNHTIVACLKAALHTAPASACQAICTLALQNKAFQSLAGDEGLVACIRDVVLRRSLEDAMVPDQQQPPQQQPSSPSPAVAVEPEAANEQPANDEDGRNEAVADVANASPLLTLEFGFRATGYLCGAHRHNRALAGGCVRLLVSALQHFPGALALQRCALGALADVCNGSLTNQDDAAEAEAMAAVKNTLETHASDRAVVLQACRLVATLCRGSVLNQRQARYHSVLLCVVDAMAEFADDARVQRYGCAALRNVCFQNAQAQTEAFEFNCLPRIAHALEAFVSEEDVVCAAASALRNVAFNLPAVLDDAACTIEPLIACGLLHLDSERVQTRVWGALYCLSFSADNQMDMFENGLTELLQGVLGKDRNSAPHVVVAVLHTLSVLAGLLPQHMDALREAGAIAAIAHAMRAHPRHAPLQEAACHALAEACLMGDLNQEAALTAQCIPLILKAMELHCEDDHVRLQGRACSALFGIANDNPASLAAAAEHDALSRVRKALARYRNHPDLVCEALKVTGVLTSEDAQGAMREAGWLRDIVKLMAEFAKDDEVLEAACGALEYLVADCEQSCDAALDEGVVDILLAALQAHRDSDGLVLHGCLVVHWLVRGSPRCRDVIGASKLVPTLQQVGLREDLDEEAVNFAREALQAMGAALDPGDEAGAAAEGHKPQPGPEKDDGEAQEGGFGDRDVECRGCRDSRRRCAFVVLPCSHFVCSKCSQDACGVCQAAVERRVACNVAAAGDSKPGAALRKNQSLAHVHEHRMGALGLRSQHSSSGSIRKHSMAMPSRQSMPVGLHRNRAMSTAVRSSVGAQDQ